MVNTFSTLFDLVAHWLKYRKNFIGCSHTFFVAFHVFNIIFILIEFVLYLSLSKDTYIFQIKCVRMSARSCFLINIYVFYCIHVQLIIFVGVLKSSIICTLGPWSSPQISYQFHHNFALIISICYFFVSFDKFIFSKLIVDE